MHPFVKCCGIFYPEASAGALDVAALTVGADPGLYGDALGCGQNGVELSEDLEIGKFDSTRADSDSRGATFGCGQSG